MPLRTYPDLFIRKLKQRDLVTINPKYLPIFKSIEECGKDDFTINDTVTYSDLQRSVVARKLGQMAVAGVLVRTSRTVEGKLFKYAYRAKYLRILETFMELDKMFTDSLRRMMALDAIAAIGSEYPMPLATLLVELDLTRSNTELHRFLKSADGQAMIEKEYLPARGAPVILRLTDHGKKVSSLIQTLSYGLKNLKSL